MSVQLSSPCAVLFDLGNTILDELHFDLEAGISAVATEDVDIAALASGFRSALAAHHRENRELLLAEWLRARVPALTAVPLTVIEDRIWSAVVTLVPSPGIAPVLRRLSDDDVPTAAVSNAAFSGRVLCAELARHGLADGFRFVLSSADVASRKPGVPIFKEALKRLGVRASDVWFVGDTLDEDIAGAISAGLQAVWFSRGRTAPSMFADVPAARDWAEFTVLYTTVRTGTITG